MKRHIKIITALILFFLTAKNIHAQNCQALFNYTIDHEISSLTYNFEDRSVSSSPIIAYFWDFGDGNNSVKQNPQHQYLSEGNYIVSLRIITSDSCFSYFSDTLKVTKTPPPSCMAYFTFVFISQSANYTYAFTDHSIAGTGDTIISWYWTFGDGSTSNLQNPVHQFVATGNYNVSLFISTVSGCSASYSFTLNIYNGTSPCQASFTYSQDSTGNLLKYHFHDNSYFSTSISSWQWHFDDGDSSMLQDPDHVFPYAGIYFVSLTITTSGGCTSTISYPVQVSTPQPYNLWGRVYAGPYVIDKCIAYLYKEFNNNYFRPIDTVRLTSVNDTLGVYYFFQVPEGKHKVKVLLPDSSIYSQDYAPTYYGDELRWDKASTINLFQDISLANVNLKELKSVNGTSRINVNVVSSNPNITVAGTELLLYDSKGDLTHYAFADAQGKVTFDNVEKGAVYISGEVTGLLSIPVKVTLNDYDTINNLTINVGQSYITGILKLETNKEIEFKLYPNPVENNLFLDFARDIKEPLLIEIYDLQGRKTFSKKIDLPSTSLKINTAASDKGVYLLKLTTIKSGRYSTIKFIKN